MFSLKTRKHREREKTQSKFFLRIIFCEQMENLA